MTDFNNKIRKRVNQIFSNCAQLIPLEQCLLSQKICKYI